MHFDEGNCAQGQRPGNKPAQGNALGNACIVIEALKGRNIVCRSFRALTFLNKIPRALPWAGLFSHLWRSY